MAVTAPTIRPRDGRHLGSADQSLLEFPEASTQTFKEGEFVRLVSGYLEVAATGATQILGIATMDASGTQGTKIPVMMLDLNHNIIINLKGNASADYVLAQTDLGVAYDIQVSSNTWTLNQSDTTNPKFKVVEFHPNYAVGDTNAWVYAQPLAATLQPIVA